MSCSAYTNHIQQTNVSLPLSLSLTVPLLVSVSSKSGQTKYSQHSIIRLPKFTISGQCLLRFAFTRPCSVFGASVTLNASREFSTRNEKRKARRLSLELVVWASNELLEAHSATQIISRSSDDKRRLKRHLNDARLIERQEMPR